MNMTEHYEPQPLVYIRDNGEGQAEICLKVGGNFVAVPISNNQLVNIILRASEILARDVRSRKEIH